MIHENENGKIWFKPDKQFLLPKGKSFILYLLFCYLSEKLCVSIFYEYESFQSVIKEWNFKQADVEFVSSVHFH